MCTVLLPPGINPSAVKYTSSSSSYKAVRSGEGVSKLTGFVIFGVLTVVL
jgi:hypothetical protein